MGTPIDYWLRAWQAKMLVKFEAIYGNPEVMLTDSRDLLPVLQFGLEREQVLPRLTFSSGAAQQKGGVIGGDRWNGSVQSFALQREPATAQTHDAVGAPEQCSGGRAAAEHHCFRAQQCDVAPDEGQAGGDLLVGRLAVAGRPPEQDIGDVSVAVAAIADRGEHAVEQLAAAADERLAQPVLVGARRFRAPRGLSRPLQGAALPSPSLRRASRRLAPVRVPRRAKARAAARSRAAAPADRAPARRSPRRRPSPRTSAAAPALRPSGEPSPDLSVGEIRASATAAPFELSSQPRPRAPACRHLGSGSLMSILYSARLRT